MNWLGSNVENTDTIDANNINVTSLNGGHSPILDVRQYSSYYLSAQVSGPGAPTGYNLFIVQFYWFSDGGGSSFNYVDAYKIFANQGGGFSSPGGQLFGQDVHHGAFMQLFFQNKGPDTVNFSYALNGTTRVLPGPYYRECEINVSFPTSSADNWILTPGQGQITGLAAGGFINRIGFMRYGQVWMRTNMSQAFDVTMYAGDDTTALGSVAGAAGIQEKFMIFPKQAVRFIIHNASGGFMDGSIAVCSENVKF